MNADSRTLGVAVIGCGMISRFHLEAMGRVPQLEVVGVWDANAELAADVASQWATKSFNSFSEVLDDPRVDVVDVCLPSGLHGRYGVKAANAGKHVIVEKPIDVTLEAAKLLIEACKAQNVYLAAILQTRFSPTVVKIKEALEANALGRLLYGEAAIKWYRPREYYTSRQARGTLAYDGGGALLNQGIHTIDLLLWFMGDVRSVRSFVRTAYHPIEFEDLATSIVEFSSGALGTIVGSTAMPPGFPERLELYGEKGSIVLEAGQIVRWQVDGDRGEQSHEAPVGSGSSDPGAIPVENHAAQFHAIAQAILAGKQPPVSGEEALKPLKLILDIYRLSDQ